MRKLTTWVNWLQLTSLPFPSFGTTKLPMDWSPERAWRKNPLNWIFSWDSMVTVSRDNWSRVRIYYESWIRITCNSMNSKGAFFIGAQWRDGCWISRYDVRRRISLAFSSMSRLHGTASTGRSSIREALYGAEQTEKYDKWSQHFFQISLI